MALSQSRHESLQARHSAIEAQLRELSRHPSASDAELRHLKLEKLRIKEELES